MGLSQCLPGAARLCRDAAADEDLASPTVHGHQVPALYVLPSVPIVGVWCRSLAARSHPGGAKPACIFEPGAGA